MKNKTEDVEPAIVWRWFCMGVLILSIVISGILSYQRDSALNRLKTSEKTIIELQDSISNILEFSPNNVMIYLKFYEIDAVDTVYRQSVLETGHFRSKVFKENNNLFGMKHPRRRETTSMMDSQGYAVYQSYLESIKDYKLYQNRYYKGGNYYIFLESAGYSTDTSYTDKLNKVRNVR